VTYAVSGFSRTVIRGVTKELTGSVPRGPIQHDQGAAAPQAGVDSAYGDGGEMRRFGMPQSSQAGQKYTRCQRVW